MEVLQLLSKDDMIALQQRFEMGASGDGLSQDEFIEVFRDLLACKARGEPYTIEPVMPPSLTEALPSKATTAGGGYVAFDETVFQHAQPPAALRKVSVKTNDPLAMTATPRKSVVAERLQSITTTDSSIPLNVIAERADLLLRWTPEELATLFQEVDFNGDRNVSFDEFTSFAIASAVHQNQFSAQEKPFKEYHVMRDLPFIGQSHHLRNVIYCPPSERAISIGFTKTLAHDAASGRTLHSFEKAGNFLDAAYVPSQGLYIISNDQNQVLVVEDAPAGSPANTMLTARFTVQCDRAVTQVVYAPYRTRVILGDRDGVVRTINFEKLRQAAIRNAVTMAAIATSRVKLFEEGIGCVVVLPLGTPVGVQSDTTAGLKVDPMSSVAVVTPSLGSEVVLWDYETGAKLRSMQSGLKEKIRDVSYCSQHQLILCSGNESYFTAFSVDQPQQYPYEIRDVAAPHLHPIINVHSVVNTHRVITMDHSGVVKLWDMRQMTCESTFAVPRTTKNELNSIASYRFDDLNDRFIALGKETIAFEYDKRVTALFAHDDPLISINFSRHFNAIISVTATQFRHWSLSSGTAVSARKDLPVPPGATIPVHLAGVEVTCAALDDVHGRQMFLGLSDGCIAGVLVTTGRELWRKQISKARIVFIYFVSRGVFLVGNQAGFAYVATESDEGTLELVQLTVEARPCGLSLSCFAPGAGVAAVTSATHRRAVYLYDGIHRSSTVLWDASDSPRHPEVAAMCILVDGGAADYGIERRASPGHLSPHRGTNELTLIAIGDTNSHVHIWCCGRNINSAASRQELMTLRVPKRAVITALTALGSRYLVCGTDSGSIVVWDLAELIVKVAAPWRPSWSAADLIGAASAVGKPSRFMFSTHGQEHIGVLAPVPYAMCVVAGTSDDDPLLFIWDLQGNRRGTLCRGRGTAAADDLGSMAAFAFDVSAFEAPGPAATSGARPGTAGSLSGGHNAVDVLSMSCMSAVALGDILFGTSLIPEGRHSSLRTASPLTNGRSTTVTSVDGPSAALSRQSEDEEKRRRKHQRHARKHLHDKDMITSEALEKEQPIFLQELICSDPVVARHQGTVSPVRNDRVSDGNLGSGQFVSTPPLGGSDNQPFTITLSRRGSHATGGGAETARGPRGILKPEVDRVPSAMLAMIREQAQATLSGRGQFGSIRLQHRGGPNMMSASLEAPSATRRERTASVAFVEQIQLNGSSEVLPTAEYSIPLVEADDDSAGDASPTGGEEETTNHGSPLLHFDGGRGSRRTSTASMHDLDHRRAFQRLDGATPVKDMDDVKQRNLGLRSGQNGGGLPLPKVPANNFLPHRPQFQGARLRRFNNLPVPDSVPLPSIPQVTMMERGWQQIIRAGDADADRPRSPMKGEVSARIAERQLQVQYETEVAKMKQDRANFLKAKGAPANPHGGGVLDVLQTTRGRVKEAQRKVKVRLDRTVEQRHFELGTSSVAFSARGWQQRVVGVSPLDGSSSMR